MTDLARAKSALDDVITKFERHPYPSSYETVMLTQLKTARASLEDTQCFNVNLGVNLYATLELQSDLGVCLVVYDASQDDRIISSAEWTPQEVCDMVRYLEPCL